MAGMLTVLDIPDRDPGTDALARLQLRRLANRHGCHENHCGHPDPDVHNADVEYLHQWLQMLGLEPYKSMPGTHRVGPLIVNYERPGGSRRP